MRNNLVHDIPLLLIPPRANLAGQRHLLVVLVLLGALLALRDHVQVDAGRLARVDARGDALLAEVQLGAVDLVEEHRRDGLEHLQGKVLRLDGVDGGDEGLDDEREAVGVFDRDGVGFALEDDGGVGALGDEDRLGEGDFDFDGGGFLVEVFLLCEGSLGYLRRGGKVRKDVR
jgi:hypothetical protein